MDDEVTHWINSFAGVNPFVDEAMIRITQVGVPVIIAFVVLQWWSGSDRTHVRHSVVSAGMAFLLGLVINQGLLLFIHRMRPYDAGVSHLLIAPSADWSFPSDHATATISVCATFFLNKLASRTIVLFLAALLVCCSRIYVGTHYVTDIVGGALTGVMAALIVRNRYREHSYLDRILTNIL